MSARDRARRIQLSAYEYITEVWKRNGTFTKSQAVVLSNQHKLERTLKLSQEYLEKIPSLIIDSAPGSKRVSDLEEARSLFELITELLVKVPKDKLGYYPERKLVLESFFTAQELVARQSGTN